MPLTMRRASVVLPFLLLLVTVPACGGDKRATRIEITTETVTYRDGDVELEGYLAYDAARTGKRPGVLVIHEWWGSQSTRKSAHVPWRLSVMWPSRRTCTARAS